MGKSRAEYMRDYRRRKRQEKLKNGKAEPKKIARSSTERNRDFRARKANSILSQTSTADPTIALPNLVSHAALPLLPVPFSPTLCTSTVNTCNAGPALFHPRPADVKQERVVGEDDERVEHRTPGSHPHSPAAEEDEERLHDQVSVPCSPLYIKEEREFEDSPTDPSPTLYIKREREFEDSPTEPRPTSCIKEERREEETDLKVFIYDAILSKLQQEMAVLKRENQLLVEENRTLTAKEGNSMNDGQKLNILATTEDSVISKLKNDNQSLAEEKLRLTDEIESIKGKSERNIQKLTEKNKDCLAKIQKLESKIQELNKRIEDLTDSDKLAEKNQDLYEKVQYLNQKVEHLNKETAEFNHRKSSK